MKPINQKNIQEDDTMTCKQRIMAIRLMEKMEKSSKVTKEDGTMVYRNNDGEVLVTARMTEKSKS